jgi:hypothetical protein
LACAHATALWHPLANVEGRYGRPVPHAVVMFAAVAAQGYPGASRGGEVIRFAVTFTQSG